jgi:hypothetical protein
MRGGRDQANIRHADEILRLDTQTCAFRPIVPMALKIQRFLQADFVTGARIVD